jgi:hypothetical protein
MQLSQRLTSVLVAASKDARRLPAWRPVAGAVMVAGMFLTGREKNKSVSMRLETEAKLGREQLITRET